MYSCVWNTQARMRFEIIGIKLPKLWKDCCKDYHVHDASCIWINLKSDTINIKIILTLYSIPSNMKSHVDLCTEWKAIASCYSMHGYLNNKSIKAPFKTKINIDGSYRAVSSLIISKAEYTFTPTYTLDEFTCVCKEVFMLQEIFIMMSVGCGSSSSGAGVSKMNQEGLLSLCPQIPGDPPFLAKGVGLRIQDVFLIKRIHLGVCLFHKQKAWEVLGKKLQTQTAGKPIGKYHAKPWCAKWMSHINS